MSKLFRFVNEAAKRAYVALPPDVQRQFGHDLNAVQLGERPFSAFKDIGSSVGKGAIELIENGSPAFRAVYCAKYLDTVYVLHAFTKTCNGTDRAAMKTAASRYGLMMSQIEQAERVALTATRKALDSIRKR